MKEAAAASRLPTVELSHLRQTSGGRGASKVELMDAIDGLFARLDVRAQDRTAAYMVAELLRRSSETTRERLEELLERVGWRVVTGEPVPLDLRVDFAPEALPEAVRVGVAKAIRRYRDGDFDGAMTFVVGVIDTLTETIYTDHSIPGHKQASYQQRAVTAHKALEAQFRARLLGMGAGETDLAWKGQHRAVNGAADLLSAFRRTYSDAHGVALADAGLVQIAMQAALFLIYSLTS
jgi:hypothetical protein